MGSVKFRVSHHNSWPSDEPVKNSVFVFEWIHRNDVTRSRWLSSGSVANCGSPAVRVSQMHTQPSVKPPAMQSLSRLLNWICVHAARQFNVNCGFCVFSVQGELYKTGGLTYMQDFFCFFYQYPICTTENWQMTHHVYCWHTLQQFADHLVIKMCD